MAGSRAAIWSGPRCNSLLADIRAGRIDIVVVYKVDRLTRSLADFARLVEIFDAQGVSFVSVTQQFNTTSSMGRLTLNVLLSFAQFEREVTGERIRDKIAASKKKGMWMGGNVPLGYDASERTLVINPAEAETVRRIFALYRELGCVRRVKEEADRLGLRTKCSTTANGTERGGKPFSRGHLYRLLSNPIYTGRIAHKGELYPGQHPALIDDETWAAVRDQLAANASNHRRKGESSRAEPAGGLAGRCSGGAAHAITRRQERPTLSLLRLRCPDHRGRNGSGARLAARRQGDRRGRDQDPGRRADQPGKVGRAVWRSRHAQRPNSETARSCGPSCSSAQGLAGGTSKSSFASSSRKFIVDENTIIIKLRRGPLLGGDVASSASEAASDSAIELTATARLQAARCRNQAGAARISAAEAQLEM